MSGSKCELSDHVFPVVVTVMRMLVGGVVHSLRDEWSQGLRAGQLLYIPAGGGRLGSEIRGRRYGSRVKTFKLTFVNGVQVDAGNRRNCRIVNDSN